MNNSSLLYKLFFHLPFSKLRKEKAIDLGFKDKDFPFIDRKNGPCFLYVKFKLILYFVYGNSEIRCGYGVNPNER